MNKINKEKTELSNNNNDGYPPSTTEDFSEITQEQQNELSAKKQKQAISLSDSRQLATKKSSTKKQKDAHSKKHNKRIVVPWVLMVFLLTMIFSFLFGILSQLVIGKIEQSTVFIAYILILVIVIISIIADMIGVASTSCNLEPLYAMSARKVKGAKLAVKLAKSANVVSSICCDVIGDICGIISGACGAAIVAVMSIKQETQLLVVSVLVSTIIAGLMITGKAIGKKLAIRKSTDIIFTLAKIMSIFSKK